MKRKIYNNLLNWKLNNITTPYMLVGARQTGKTFIIDEFCKNEFKNYIYINLDLQDNIRQIFEDTINPEEIIRNIEIVLDRTIDIDTTVIFLDEVQVSERAISSLKYFNESDKPYKIIVAGSLLGVKINRFKSSFPVGKVWIDYLHPMDFEEFLWAIGEEKLAEMINNHFLKMEPMEDVIHKKALKLYNEYLCVGGMPVAILSFINFNKDIYSFNDDILNMINMSYLADMNKYTENIESIRNSKIYNAIPMELGKINKKFKYSLVDKSARKREYETSLKWLLDSNMIIKVNNVSTPQSPLKVYTLDSFKIYLSDVGLLRVLSKISINEILKNTNMIYKGAFIENYVAENLFSKYRDLYCWEYKNEYEMDFLINIDGDIIPIEVKSKENVISKSLKYYMEKFKPKYAICLSEKNFGESNKIKSIPLYASYLI